MGSNLFWIDGISLSIYRLRKVKFKMTHNKILHKRGGDLERTLLAYIASDRSASKAADKLHIHINTLYQRVKKIEDILGLSFGNQEHMLRMQLACYLRESYGTAK